MLSWSRTAAFRTVTCAACRRSFSHATLPTRLPRIAPRFAQQTVQEEAEQTQRPPTASVESTSEELPWFLEAEQVERPPPLSSLPSYSIMQPPTSTPLDLPPTLSSLYTHITQGPASGLLARKDSSTYNPGWEEDPGPQRDPIAFIPVRAIAPEDAWSDWVAVVQVRGAAGGAVSKVALEIGNFLKHNPPPKPMQVTLEQNGPPSLDELLGTPEPARPPKPSKFTANETTSEETAPSTRPPGMSRIEWLAGRPLPAWEVQKRALASKLGSAPWSPSKILSREAQNGLRLIHSSDPQRFSAPFLAERFRISVESVRRILRGGKWEAGAQVEERQNRRARERVEEWRSVLVGRAREALAEGGSGEDGADWRSRQEAETERITEEIFGLVQGEVDAAEAQVPSTQETASTPPVDERPTYQPISYEGLVDPSSPLPRSSSRSPMARGEGDWCLVDADWVVVHVMTAEAREKWGIEGTWEERVRIGEEERKRRDEGEEVMIRSPSRLANRASLNEGRYRRARVGRR